MMTVWFAEHGPQTRNGTFEEGKPGTPRPSVEVHERDLEPTLYTVPTHVLQ